MKKLFASTLLFFSLTAYSGNAVQQSEFSKQFFTDQKKIIQLRKNEKQYNNIYKVVYGTSGMIDENVPYGELSFGSAVSFNDKSGRSYYLMAKHLVKTKFDYDIKNKGLFLYDVKGRKLEAKIEEMIPEHDICIVSTKKDDLTSKKLSFISYKDLYPGEDCYTAGWPQGHFRMVKKSNIGSVVNLFGKKYIAIDEEGTGAYSGGGNFVTRKGELKLAGIISIRDSNKKIFYAVPYDYFKDALKKYL